MRDAVAYYESIARYRRYLYRPPERPRHSFFSTATAPVEGRGIQYRLAERWGRGSTFHS